MKNFILIVLAGLFIFVGCTKDNVLPDQALQNLPAGVRSDGKVTVCHLNGNGSYNAQEISVSALEAHLAHGDYLPDADGDGYSAPGACTGSMDDCNDNDATVNPGAEEVCGDGIDNNCDGSADEGCCNFNGSTLTTHQTIWYYDLLDNDCDNYEDFGVTELLVFRNSNSNQDINAYIIGEDYYVNNIVVDESQYNCAVTIMRAFIAAHPEIPNYCDIPGLKSGTSSNALVRPEILSKYKHLMSEDVLKFLNK